MLHRSALACTATATGLRAVTRRNPRPHCREFPGELQKVMEWFRDYKMPDGKPANAYGYDNQCLNAEFTKGVIEECNGFYAALKSGDRKNDVELSLE